MLDSDGRFAKSGGISPSRLSIADSSSEGRTFVLRLSGELDLRLVSQLDHQLAAALRQGDADVRVDLAEATFMDSTVLALLVAAHRDGAGRLRLVGASPPVAHVFETVGLERVLG